MAVGTLVMGAGAAVGLAALGTLGCGSDSGKDGAGEKKLTFFSSKSEEGPPKRPLAIIQSV